MSFKMTPQAKNSLVTPLQGYFEAELDRELGRLEAEFLIDFMAEQLGPRLYNEGLKDARAILQDHLNELDDALLERERPVQE